MFKLLPTIALVGSLAICAIAAPPVTRGVPEVIADYTSLSAALDKMKTDITDFDGNAESGLVTEAGANRIEKLLAKIQADADTTKPVSEAEGISIYAVIVEIVPKVQDNLGLLRSREPEFEELDEDKVGTYQQVCQNIAIMRNASKLVGAKMTDYAPADKKADAAQAEAELDAAFAATEARYENCKF